MTFNRHSPRWPFWLFALALLLKAAMPFLANASAQLQGVALAEVCTVYGVSLQPLAHDGDGTPLPHAPAAGGEHCPLLAWAAQADATPPLRAAAVPATAEVAAPPQPSSSSSARDACASWAAQLGHGPPRRG